MLGSELTRLAGPTPRPEELIGGTPHDRRVEDIRRAESHLPGNRQDRTFVTPDTEPIVTIQSTSIGRVIVLKELLLRKNYLISLLLILMEQNNHLKHQ